MQALAFWNAVTEDHANLLERFVGWLGTQHVKFCLVGGQAVNAYVEPVVSLDLDVVIAAHQLDAVRSALDRTFAVESFPHSVNISVQGSDLRIQIQLDPRYGAFVERATARNVLGLTLPVASLEDVLQEGVWAAEDITRRPSKRQKDLADIARLIEEYPRLRASVPAGLLDKLV